jgi:hypothetical protein
VLPGRIAAISAAERATALRRTCRIAAAMTVVIAASTKHRRAMADRLRFGRPACTGTVAASDGGRTDPDVSSADFTALTNRSSISLSGAKLGLAYGRCALRDCARRSCGILTSTSKRIRFS